MSPGRRLLGPNVEPVELREGEELTVFRIVRTPDAATAELVASFMSRAALGLPPRPGTPEEMHPLISEGISVYETRDAAVETARRVRARGRGLGDFVAELRLTPDLEVRYSVVGCQRALDHLVRPDQACK